MPRVTVDVAVTLLATLATTAGGVRPAAVDVRLVAVSVVIDTVVDDADPRTCVTTERVAITVVVSVSLPSCWRSAHI